MEKYVLDKWQKREKKNGKAILRSEKLDFKGKSLTRDRVNEE